MGGAPKRPFGFDVPAGLGAARCGGRRRGAVKFAIWQPVTKPKPSDGGSAGELAQPCAVISSTTETRGDRAKMPAF